MNILFIPHIPNRKVVNRVYEFAKNSNSFSLYWSMESGSLTKKIISQIDSLKYKIDGKNLHIPILFKPENIAPKINTITLNLLIKKLNIDVVINANALLFDIKSISVPVIYDLVDDHLEINRDIGLNLKRVDKIREDIKASKGVICVTKILEDKVKKLQLNRKTITIENGLYIDRFKRAKSLKSELGLSEKKVFGYIGGVEAWSGIEKACEAFMRIKDDSNSMIIVGDSNKDFFRSLKKRYEKDIMFLGHINPDEVAQYFKTVDIGLIPFTLNNFTNNSLPIKALEYGLAGATVLSTPLKYLKIKKFPFIEFSDIDNFDKAMKKIQKKNINFNFNEYDWKILSQKVIDFAKTTI